MASAILCDVFAFLHRGATTFGGVDEFSSKTQIHRFLATLLGGFTEPTHSQGQAAHGAHFNRHLVVGTAHAAALHFDDRLDVVDGQVEDFDGILAGLDLNLSRGHRR